MSEHLVHSRLYDVLLRALLSHCVKEIGVDDVDDMQGVQIVDSREPEEYRVSHISGAIAVGYKTPDENAIETLEKTKPVIVYCSVGYRSEKLARQLENAGFKQVYNLYGGIFEWVNRGRPVFNASGQTDDIHPYSWLWGQLLERGHKTTRPPQN